MFSMTILFGNPALPWTLLFKTEETANAAWASYRATKANSFEGDELHITDDFGQTASIKRASIHGALFENMDESKLAHVERGLHNLRTQIAADKAGMADPAIMAHMRTKQMQSPAMLGLGPNGAFRPQ